MTFAAATGCRKALGLVLHGSMGQSNVETGDDVPLWRVVSRRPMKTGR